MKASAMTGLLEPVATADVRGCAEEKPGGKQQVDEIEHRHLAGTRR